MRNWTKVLLAGVVAVWAGAAQAQTPRELTVIVYGGSFEEGWRKAVIEPFEKANPDIKVRIATGLTMETVAMMRAQKADPKIDVIMMDEVGAAQANGEGLYEPLTTAKIPNMDKLYPQFRIAGDPYTKFMYVAQVLAYDKAHVKTPPTSWKDLWNPAYKGFVAIPDIDTTHGTMMLMMAARINGGSEKDIGPGFDALKALKPNIVTFWKQHAQVSQMFTQGDIYITSWTSDRAAGPDRGRRQCRLGDPAGGRLHHRFHDRHRQGQQECRRRAALHQFRAWQVRPSRRTPATPTSPRSTAR